MTADRARGAVLITGASTGIGAACALHLDRVGFRVWAGVRRSSDGEALVGQASRRLTPIILDVTDSNSIAAALADVGADAGGEGLAGPVNNAGIVVAAPVEILPLAELRKQLEVNVIGLVAVTQAALPLLRRGRGRVVNMGSISGRMATPGHAPERARGAAPPSSPRSPTGARVTSSGEPAPLRRSRLSPPPTNGADDNARSRARDRACAGAG